MKPIFYFLAVIFVTLGLSSCDDQTQFEKDTEKIQDYLRENGIDAEQHRSGVWYHIDQEGTGSNPSFFANVIVRYKGSLLDGRVFDQTQGNQTVEFRLNQTISGFQVGVTLLKKGGKGTFYLPSGVGYGRQGTPSIPGNSILIFEIELVDFVE